MLMHYTTSPEPYPYMVKRLPIVLLYSSFSEQKIGISFDGAIKDIIEWYYMFCQY